MFNRKFYKELDEAALRADLASSMRKKMGWGDVHEELQSLPYCGLQKTITKVYDCNKCNSCKIPGLCVSCWENEMKYHILVDREEVNDLAEKGLVKGWMDPRRPSEREEEYREACEMYRELIDAKENLKRLALEDRKLVFLKKFGLL